MYLWVLAIVRLVNRKDPPTAGFTILWAGIPN